jgi:hypothetical protein
LKFQFILLACFTVKRAPSSKGLTFIDTFNPSQQAGIILSEIIFSLGRSETQFSATAPANPENSRKKVTKESSKECSLARSFYIYNEIIAGCSKKTFCL